MGVGSITGAREVTQGVVHAAHDGAGESAGRIAAIGAHAGREAQRTIAAGLGDAAKNIGDTLKVVGDFAVAALWEKPIAEAEQEIRELDLKSRTEGWWDENGVERPGFELYKGAEAAGIGDKWEAYMAREAKKISDKYGLTDGQRQELSTRTRKLRVETKARLAKYGMSEAMDSNLRDIDLRATRDGERNIAGAVASAAQDGNMAARSASASGVSGDANALLEVFDNEAVQLLSDNLVEKREKLIRDKVIGGLGRKSEEVATAEADKIVRAEALETVKALAAAGHYDRARKLVEQGKKLGYDDAALAKGRELVDKYEEKAQKDAFNGVQATAQSAIAMGWLNGEVDPKTRAKLPGMEDALAEIWGAKEKFAVGTEMRANYDKLEAQVTDEAEKAQAAQYLSAFANKESVSVDPKTGTVEVVRPDGIEKGSWKERAFEAAKVKYLKAVEQNNKDIRAARDQIWKDNGDLLKGMLVAYNRAISSEGGIGSKEARQAYSDLMRNWNEVENGGLDPDFALGFQKTVKDLDRREIAEGMAAFWRMLKDVKIESNLKFIGGLSYMSSVPKLGKDGSISAESVKGMEAGAYVGFDTGDTDNPFTMTVSDAISFSEQVRKELNLMDPKEIRKSEAVETVVRKVYTDVAKRLAEGRISRSEVGAELARDWGERMAETKMLLGRTKATTLVEAVETERQQAEWRKQYAPQK